MLASGRNLVAPLYLLACLILGGSAQGIWQNMLLQLAGLAIIAWTALAFGDERLSRPAKQLLLLFVLFLLVLVLQMIPLPPGIWSHVGPRGAIANGYRTLGIPLPFEPLSLDPASGSSALLTLIPPVAIFCAMARMRAYRLQWLAAALIAGTIAGIALGALQVASSTAENSPWYLYEETNPGRGVGFFANANHMAILLVIAIPFLAAFVATSRSGSKQRRSAVVAAVAGAALVVVVGLALNGSIAGYGLAPPVLAASMLLLIPQSSRWRKWIVGLAALLVIGAVAALQTTSIAGTKIGADAVGSFQSRVDILTTTWRAIGDFLPFGSGLGSFRKVYPLYEQLNQVAATFVIHAHNDYAEIALELGLAGIILMLLFLTWWGRAVLRVWRTADAGPFARAAAIASAAVLTHSVVDFPLRTAAIAACFGMCLALLADSRSAPLKERSQLRRARHVEFR